MKNRLGLRKIRKTTKIVELLHVITIPNIYSAQHVEEMRFLYKKNFPDTRHTKHKVLVLISDKTEISIINLSTLETSNKFVYQNIIPLLPEQIREKITLDLILKYSDI